MLKATAGGQTLFEKFSLRDHALIALKVYHLYGRGCLNFHSMDFFRSLKFPQAYLHSHTICCVEIR